MDKCLTEKHCHKQQWKLDNKLGENSFKIHKYVNMKHMNMKHKAFLLVNVRKTEEDTII